MIYNTTPFRGSYSECDGRSDCDASNVRSLVNSEMEGKWKKAGRSLIWGTTRHLTGARDEKIGRNIRTVIWTWNLPKTKQEISTAALYDIMTSSAETASFKNFHN